MRECVNCYILYLIYTLLRENRIFLYCDCVVGYSLGVLVQLKKKHCSKTKADRKEKGLRYTSSLRNMIFEFTCSGC